jgi:putative transcriptional regulator
MKNRSKIGLALEASLREAIAHKKGKITLPTRVVAEMSAARVKEIRKRLAKSPKEFERNFGVPARTLEGWEQGKKIGVAERILLQVIEKEPAAVERALAS